MNYYNIMIKKQIKKLKLANNYRKCVLLNKLRK